jgi:hypothetical protein
MKRYHTEAAVSSSLLVSTFAIELLGECMTYLNIQDYVSFACTCDHMMRVSRRYSKRCTNLDYILPLDLSSNFQRPLKWLSTSFPYLHSLHNITGDLPPLDEPQRSPTSLFTMANENDSELLPYNDEKEVSNDDTTSSPSSSLSLSSRGSKIEDLRTLFQSFHRLREVAFDHANADTANVISLLPLSLTSLFFTNLVRWDFDQSSLPFSRFINLAHLSITLREPAHLKRLPRHLRSLSIDGLRMTDSLEWKDAFAHFTSLKSLHVLLPISEPTLAPIVASKTLDTLIINRAFYGPLYWWPLSQIHPGITSITINNRVSNTAVKSLVYASPSLRYLSIDIRDDSLDNDHVHELLQLKHLNELHLTICRYLTALSSLHHALVSLRLTEENKLTSAQMHELVLKPLPRLVSFTLGITRGEPYDAQLLLMPLLSLTTRSLVHLTLPLSIIKSTLNELLIAYQQLTLSSSSIMMPQLQSLTFDNNDYIGIFHQTCCGVVAMSMTSLLLRQVPLLDDRDDLHDRVATLPLHIITNDIPLPYRDISSSDADMIEYRIIDSPPSREISTMWKLMQSLSPPIRPISVVTSMKPIPLMGSQLTPDYQTLRIWNNLGVRTEWA